MRIITGSARGRRLLTLEGEHVRPTTERVKEALFSILQFQIEGRRVLDLICGVWPARFGSAQPRCTRSRLCGCGKGTHIDH
ncbi:RsmD family RNA methyltransferase [Anaeromassilibacillus sp. SJQ-1]|uniref:RsmD family RNA methyltransferase n=1 Tax=Anaeromassilibacillus sp. SJQ-1 TaxID=3375419 RepID=UPI003989602A